MNWIKNWISIYEVGKAKKYEFRSVRNWRTVTLEFDGENWNALREGAFYKKSILSWISWIDTWKCRVFRRQDLSFVKNSTPDLSFTFVNFND